MEVIELVGEMQSICDRLRAEGRRLRLVATMGALHIGHASLIRAAAYDTIHLQASAHKHHSNNSNDNNNNGACSTDDHENERQQESAKLKGVTVIVSVFANPKQFNSKSDFDSYPQTLNSDVEFCKQLNLVDYVFAPSVGEMYQNYGRNDESCMVEAPESLGQDLEGASRPGHIKGMLTIVCKLFNIIRPHESYFGEKDYQQFVSVTQMVNDLNMNINIRPVATVRDRDLLPLSSRNIRLSPKQRRAALVIHQILLDAKQSLEYEMDKEFGDITCQHILMASAILTICKLNKELSDLVEYDYLELRCAKDLSRIHLDKSMDDAYDCKCGCIRKRLQTNDSSSSGDNEILDCRLLVSIIVGGVRLLDNIEFRLKSRRRTG